MSIPPEEIASPDSGFPAVLDVLVVDDEDSICQVLDDRLTDWGHRVVTALTLQEARQALTQGALDLVLLDVNLPDGNGVELLEDIRELAEPPAVVVMSARGSIEIAVSAIRRGARDFLSKPISSATLRRLMTSYARSKRDGVVEEQESSICGESQAMKEVWRIVRSFAPTDIGVLLLGESGTGKELTARAIHDASLRASGPFVDFDCAAVPGTLLDAELFGHEKGAFTDARKSRAGKFELADGGTLFLDEIGNLSYEAQAKLLRVLQERRFRRVGGTDLIASDVRIVAATNLDLDEEIRKGNFREDLFYRIAEMSIPLPPLREREGDLPRLCERFIREYNEKHGKAVAEISAEALAVLSAHAWPGNVRELRSTIRTASVLGETRIGVEHLPPRFRGKPAEMPVLSTDDSRFLFPIVWPGAGEKIDLKKLTREARRRLEALIIRGLVQRYGYSKAELARCLELDYKMVLQKLRDLELDSLSRDGRKRPDIPSD